MNTTEKSSESRSSVRNRSRGRGRQLVLLDTNALLLPVGRHFPLESEVERLRPGSVIEVPSSVAGELDRLVARGVVGARAARDLATRFPTLAAPGRGDRAVLDAATSLGACVVTADRAFAEELHQRGVDVLAPRDREHLELRRGRRTGRGSERRGAAE